jgi:hypothetical protein
MLDVPENVVQIFLDNTRWTSTDRQVPSQGQLAPNSLDAVGVYEWEVKDLGDEEESGEVARDAP